MTDTLKPTVVRFANGSAIKLHASHEVVRSMLRPDPWQHLVGDLRKHAPGTSADDLSEAAPISEDAWDNLPRLHCQDGGSCQHECTFDDPCERAGLSQPGKVLWQVSYNHGESWVDWPRKPNPALDVGLAMAMVRCLSHD